MVEINRSGVNEAPKQHYHYKRKVQQGKHSTLLSINCKTMPKADTLKDLGIPYPSWIDQPAKDIIILTWAIDGYIWGSTQREVYNGIKNDLIVALEARPAILDMDFTEFKPKIVTRWNYPTITSKRHLINENVEDILIYKFKDFYNIKTPKPDQATFTRFNSKVRASNPTNDKVFDALRIQAYAKYETDRDNFTLHWLEDTLKAITKDYKADKHKAKLIYEWVTTKYKRSGSRKGLISRSRNAVIVTKENSRKKFAKLLNYIKLHQISPEDANVSELARVFNYARATIRKYLAKILASRVYGNFIRNIGVKHECKPKGVGKRSKGVDQMPKKICNMPACNRLIDMDKTYCLDHGTKQTVYSKYTRDKKSAKFYNSTAWRKKRKEIMQEFNGLCQECKANGVIREADVVDHIKELKDYPELALENSNLKPLCHTCHNLKSTKK